MGKRNGRNVAAVIAEYGNDCYICGSVPTTRDHIIPLAQGGADSLLNLRPACAPCNSLKGSLFLHEFILRYRRLLRPGFDFDIVGETRDQYVARLKYETRFTQRLQFVEKTCLSCGENFYAGSTDGKFCSRRHKDNYGALLRRQRRNNPILFAALKVSDLDTQAVVLNSIKSRKPIYKEHYEQGNSHSRSTRIRQVNLGS